MRTPTLTGSLQLAAAMYITLIFCLLAADITTSNITKRPLVLTHGFDAPVAAQREAFRCEVAAR